MRRNPDFHPRKKIIFLIPFLVIVAAVAVWIKVNPLSLQSSFVEINNAPCVTDSQIKAEISGNIWDLNEQTRRSIVDRYPCVKSLQIKRALPNKTTVVVSGRTAIAKIGSFSLPVILDNLKEATPSSQTALLNWSFPQKNEEEFYLADDEGVVFAQSLGERVFTLFLPGNISLGLRLPEEVSKALPHIVSRLEGLGINQASGGAVLAKAENGAFLIKNDFNIALSLRKDILPQLISLQLILQKAKIDERLVETVDLRFDKPVVVYGKRPNFVRN